MGCAFKGLSPDCICALEPQSGKGFKCHKDRNEGDGEQFVD